MKVTNAERLTVALWLSLEWAGDEADLYAFADAWEALAWENRIYPLDARGAPRAGSGGARARAVP